MAKKQDSVPNALRPWIEARQRFHLTDAQVQMARELGLNPKKLGKVANHRQEPWKAPLPQFIERLYVKRFGKPQPDVIGSLEEVAAARAARKAAKKEARNARKEAAARGLPTEAAGTSNDDADTGIPDGTAIDRLDSGSRVMATQPTSVKWDDLETAFQYVSSGGPYEHVAVLNRESGEFIWHSEYGDNFDEWPDDVDDEDKYLAVPHKKDLDLGTPLVFDFAREFLPEDFDEVDRIFSRRGAYGQFKGLLQRKRLLERWYVFENAATERALKEWCDDNGVVIEGRTAGDAVE